MSHLHDLKIIKGLLSEPFIYDDEYFSDMYIALRLKEGRIYNNSEVAKLPTVKASHQYYKEWMIRSNSCNKLLHYIKSHGHICNILDVGCGNGWLTARLAGVAIESVTGIDINTVEIEQARKVFKKIRRVTFLHGDIRSGVLRDKKFDLIVFAASIQYFSSLKEIINIALNYLTLQGEIHIIDSHLYRPNEVTAAKQRGKKYFTNAGFPEMANHYFHHNVDDLSSFSFSLLNNPRSWLYKLRFRKNPFYWVVIKNNKP